MSGELHFIADDLPVTRSAVERWAADLMLQLELLLDKHARFEEYLRQRDA